MMKNADRDSYYMVFRWMTTELELKGNDLIVFAIIYSFSQDVNQFQGTAGYIAELANIEKRTVMNSLKKLTEKGLIQKSKKNIDGVNFCNYISCANKFRKTDTPKQNTTEGCSNLQQGDMKKIHKGVCKIFMGDMKKNHGGYENFSHHNNIDNNRDNNIYKISKDISSKSFKKDVQGSKRYPVFFDYSGDSQIHGITACQLEMWKEAFPAVDIETELKQISVWLDTNRKNRKYDVKRFIVAWLKRNQDRAPKLNVSKTEPIKGCRI